MQEYLAHFRVQEVVQHAINKAIQIQAKDPVMHVAEFLESRGMECDAILTRKRVPVGHNERPSQAPIK